MVYVQNVQTLETSVTDGLLLTNSSAHGEDLSVGIDAQTMIGQNTPKSERLRHRYLTLRPIYFLLSLIPVHRLIIILK